MYINVYCIMCVYVECVIWLNIVSLGLLIASVFESICHLSCTCTVHMCDHTCTPSNFLQNGLLIAYLVL